MQIYHDEHSKREENARNRLHFIHLISFLVYYNAI
jgi:hypothetical protein